MIWVGCAWAWITDHATVLAAVVGALAAVAVACFTYTLKKSTDKLWEAGERQIAVANKSADAAKASAKAIVDNERPWVGPETVACDQMEANREIKTRVVIKNSGRTPAQKMQVAFGGYILQNGITPNIPITANKPAKALFPNVLDFYFPFVGHILSTNESASLIERQSVAWIIMRIDYFDSMGGAHYTNICTRWDNDRNAFVPHEDGNDAT